MRYIIRFLLINTNKDVFRYESSLFDAYLSFIFYLSPQFYLRHSMGLIIKVCVFFLEFLMSDNVHQRDPLNQNNIDEVK